MSKSSTDREPHCQLQVLPDGAHPIPLFDRVRLYLLRILVAMEKRLGRHDYVVTRVHSYTHESSGSTSGENSAGDSIEEGDWVTVRPMDEIQATLNSNGCCKGLEFMSEMSKYCGRTIRVRKKVRAIFDERAWKMLKIKNTYILDDCICDGRGLYDKEGCDRCCYFFWKVDWLQKGVQGVEFKH